MVQGIQTVSPIQQLTQRPQGTFTPQISTSRIAEALLTRPQQTLETPLEAVGSVARDLSGAFLARKSEQRAQEAQQARISSIGDLARILGQPDAPVLPQGVEGPPVATRAQDLSQFIGGAPSPAIAQQGLGFLQKELAGPQQQPFTNVKVDPSGQAFGIDPATRTFGPIPTAGAAPGGVLPFGAGQRAIDVRKLDRENAKSDRTFTASLRGENRAVSSSFRKQEDAIGRIKAVTRDKDGNLIQTPAASLALVFNFMKMLDPESVVRESEFRTAEQARGWFSNLDEEQQQRVPTAFVQMIQGATGEGRMTPEQIIDFTDRAEDIFAQSQATNAQQISTIAASAKAQGINFDRIFSKGQRTALERQEIANMSDEELEALAGGR